MCRKDFGAAWERGAGSGEREGAAAGDAGRGSRPAWGGGFSRARGLSTVERSLRGAEDPGRGVGRGGPWKAWAPGDGERLEERRRPGVRGPEERTESPPWKTQPRLSLSFFLMSLASAGQLWGVGVLESSGRRRLHWEGGKGVQDPLLIGEFLS